MNPISFWVPGVPKPAGSKRAFALKKGGVYTGRTVITDDCKTSRDWKHDVSLAARDAYKGSPITIPINLVITFHMPRPKHHFRSGKHSDELKPDAPHFCSKKPDATKLIRGVEDALTGIIWADDAQVAIQYVTKRYEDGLGPGCLIHITEAILPIWNV